VAEEGEEAVADLEAGQRKDTLEVRPRRKKRLPSLGRHWQTTSSTRTVSEFEVVSQFVINHICKEFTYSEDIGKALEERAEVDFDAYCLKLRLSVLTNDIARDMEDTEFDKIFEAQVKVFIEREAIYQSNKKKAFTLIY
jgi:hypothetical protein